MPLNTFPCTVSPIHSTGVIVVSCPALGTRDAFITDDFGMMQGADLDLVMFAHGSSTGH